ncbi:hypothetical protein U0070_000445 [Myodes glareolus]|uniref:Uncharacterized protein n=1 Tax=Myodes glareolus TaxID=447135 RepID=A0AAW0IQA0_MYOGA
MVGSCLEVMLALCSGLFSSSHEPQDLMTLQAWRQQLYCRRTAGEGLPKRPGPCSHRKPRMRSSANRRRRTAAELELNPQRAIKSLNNAIHLSLKSFTNIFQKPLKFHMLFTQPAQATRGVFVSANYLENIYTVILQNGIKKIDIPSKGLSRYENQMKNVSNTQQNECHRDISTITSSCRSGTAQVKQQFTKFLCIRRLTMMRKEDESVVDKTISCCLETPNCSATARNKYGPSLATNFRYKPNLRK